MLRPHSLAGSYHCAVHEIRISCCCHIKPTRLKCLLNSVDGDGLLTEEGAQEPSRMSWVQSRPNLVVLRTFSKSAGLAGIRVGYGAFPLELANYIWRAKQPYNVSVASETAACAALTNPAYIKVQVLHKKGYEHVGNYNY